VKDVSASEKFGGVGSRFVGTNLKMAQPQWGGGVGQHNLRKINGPNEKLGKRGE